MTEEIETMLVRRKDNGEIQNIKAYRFNPEHHKKAFFRNWWKDNVKSKKIDWNNPWIVGIGLITITAIISLIIKL